MSINLSALPADLPRPVDDGAAAHLPGLRMPGIPLPATTGGAVDLSALPGRTVVYAYPMTGVPNVALPEGWNDIPGARGCTPQTAAFQSHAETFAALGVRIVGLSAQKTEYQAEMSGRLGVGFPILSDAGFALTEALGLPSMTVDGMRLLKRLTLVLNAGIIEHAMYPVFPPDQAAAEAIAWLRANPLAPAQDGVTLYTTRNCPYCKAAKALLEGKGARFTEIDVEEDPAAAALMRARTGRGTVPQIFIGATHVGGVDDLQALDRSGGLAALLAQTVRA